MGPLSTSSLLLLSILPEKPFSDLGTIYLFQCLSDQSASRRLHHPFLTQDDLIPRLL